MVPFLKCFYLKNKFCSAPLAYFSLRSFVCLFMSRKATPLEHWLQYLYPHSRTSLDRWVGKRTWLEEAHHPHCRCAIPNPRPWWPVIERCQNNSISYARSQGAISDLPNDFLLNTLICFIWLCLFAGAHWQIDRDRDAGKNTSSFYETNQIQKKESPHTTMKKQLSGCGYPVWASILGEVASGESLIKVDRCNSMAENE